jgi:hypothetical protein
MAVLEVWNAGSLEHGAVNNEPRCVGVAALCVQPCMLPRCSSCKVKQPTIPFPFSYEQGKKIRPVRVRRGLLSRWRNGWHRKRACGRAVAAASRTVTNRATPRTGGRNTGAWSSRGFAAAATLCFLSVEWNRVVTAVHCAVLFAVIRWFWKAVMSHYQTIGARMCCTYVLENLWYRYFSSQLALAEFGGSSDRYGSFCWRKWFGSLQ